jgi:hypothetical protein
MSGGKAKRQHRGAIKVVCCKKITRWQMQLADKQSTRGRTFSKAASLAKAAEQPEYYFCDRPQVPLSSVERAGS